MWQFLWQKLIRWYIFTAIHTCICSRCWLVRGISRDKITKELAQEIWCPRVIARTHIHRGRSACTCYWQRAKDALFCFSPSSVSFTLWFMVWVEPTPPSLYSPMSHNKMLHTATSWTLFLLQQMPTNLIKHPEFEWYLQRSSPKVARAVDRLANDIGAKAKNGDHLFITVSSHAVNHQVFSRHTKYILPVGL